MTPDPPATGDDLAGDPGAPVIRPPRARRDPAAMREALDAARRRLGPAGRTVEHSAEHLRALLREAAANQTPPPPDRAGPGRAPTDPAGPAPDPIE